MGIIEAGIIVGTQRDIDWKYRYDWDVTIIQEVGGLKVLGLILAVD
jgi:hypothetical protein